jgi:hypothetical protein
MADVKIPISALVDRELEKPIVGERAVQDTPERSGVFKKKSVSSTDRLKTNPDPIRNAVKQTTKYVGKFAIKQTGTPQSTIQNITSQLAKRKTVGSGFVGKDPAARSNGSTISDEIAFQNSGTTDKILGFLRNEGTTYFTKDIMLGTQQAHLLRDVVKSIMSVGSIIETKLEAIKINTGSPEVAKQTLLERFTEGVVSSSVDALSKKASNLIGSKAKKIYDARIKPKVDDHFERFKKDRYENPDKSLFGNIKTVVSNVRKDIPDLDDLKKIFDEEIGVPTRDMVNSVQEFMAHKSPNNTRPTKQNKFKASHPSILDTIRQNVPDIESMRTSAISGIKNTWSTRVKPKINAAADATKEYYDTADIVPKEYINGVISSRGPPKDILSKIRKSATRMSDSMIEKLNDIPDKDTITSGISDTVLGVGSKINKAKKGIYTNQTLLKILEKLNAEKDMESIPPKITTVLETTKQKIKTSIDDATGDISKKISSINDTIREKTSSISQNMAPQNIIDNIFQKNKNTDDINDQEEESVSTNKIENQNIQNNTVTSHIQKLMLSIERLIGYKAKEEKTDKQNTTNSPNTQDSKLQNDTIADLLRDSAISNKDYYDKSLSLLEEIAYNTKENTLVSKGKSIFRGIRNAASTVTNAYGRILGGGLNLGAAVVKSVFSGNAPRFTDIYLKSDPKKPVITAKQLEQGLVTSDGRPIMKMSDIKTSVHDPRTGKILLTEEDLANGIVGSDGKPIKNQTQFGLIGGGTRIAIAGIKTAGQVLTSRNPIFKMYESIFTTTIGAVGSVGKLVGSSVLALVTGKAIPNAIKGGFGLAKSMLDMYKSMFNITTKVIGSMANVAYTAIARLFGFSTKKDDKKFINRDDLEETIGIRLDSIYDLLQEQFNSSKSDPVSGDSDKDGVRDNSYADYMRKKRTREEARQSKKNEPDKKTSRLSSTLAAAAAALAGKSKPDDGESSSLLGTIATGAGGYLASKIPGVKSALNAAKSAVFKKPAAAAAAGIAGAAGIGVSTLIPDSIAKNVPNISGIRTPITTPQNIPIPNVANDVRAPTPNRTVGNTATKVAEEAALDIGIKSGSKVAAEEAAKIAAKSAAKKIPILGAIAGGAFSIDRLLDGDLVGAGGELASGLVSLVPAIGTGASLAIDAWLGYRDYERANDPHTKLIIERMNAYGIMDKKLYDYALSIEKKQSEMMFGNATKLSTADFAKMAAAFGMDSKNTNVVEYFAAWYTKRFSRCFLVYLECLGKFGKKYNTDSNLTTAEVETLTKEFVAAVSKFITKYDPVKPTMDAYNAMINGTPVPGTNTSIDPAQEPRPFDPTNPSGANITNTPSNDNINIPDAQTTAQAANQNIQQIQSPQTPQNTSSNVLTGMSSAAIASVSQSPPASGGGATQAPTTPTPVQSAVAAIENRPPTTPQVPQNAIGTVSSGISTATTVAYAVPNLRPPGAPQGAPQPGPQSPPASGGGGGSSTDRLGELSAKYESGKHGSKAIGWDSTGGTSYGKYQIAAKPGGYAEFLAFAKTQGQYGADVATRLINAGPGETGSTKGAAPDTWRQLATENPTEFGKLEHNYIKKYHYDKVYKRLSPAAKEAVDKSPALQDVLWSTVVQHSGYGKNIFNDQYDPNPEVYIRKIYQNRAGRFGSSEPHVRASVQKRFLDEQVRAIGMLKNDGAVLAELEKAKAQKAMPQTPAPDTAARDSGQGGTTQAAENKTGQPSTVGTTVPGGQTGSAGGSASPNNPTQQVAASTGSQADNTSQVGQNTPSISLQPQTTGSGAQSTQPDQINQPTITAAASPQVQPTTEATPQTSNTTPPTTPHVPPQQVAASGPIVQPVMNTPQPAAFKPEVLSSAIAQGQATSAASFAASMARMETTITTVFGTSGPLAEILAKQSTPQSPIQQAQTAPQLQPPANQHSKIDLNIDKSRQPRYTG